MCAQRVNIAGFEQSASRSTAARILHETIYQALQVLNYRTFGDTGLSLLNLMQALDGLNRKLLSRAESQKQLLRRLSGRILS